MVRELTRRSLLVSVSVAALCGLAHGGTVQPLMVLPDIASFKTNGNLGAYRSIHVSNFNGTGVLGGADFVLSGTGCTDDGGVTWVTDVATPTPNCFKRTSSTSYVDSDASLAADSDARLASQRAIKAYVDAHPPGGQASGDLAGDYPDPSVVGVNGVAYPGSPSTNTVPVVTAPNVIIYEAVPNAALANSSVTIAGHSVSLGGSQPLACSDLTGAAPSCETDATNANNIAAGTLASAHGGAGPINGIVKANGSGVTSQAVANTDYLPATNGSAVQKANGAGGLTAATAGTDYAPPTSGAGYQKGNGAGGFTNTATVNMSADMSGTMQATQEPAHTGDVTNSAGSLAMAVVKINGSTPATVATSGSYEDLNNQPFVDAHTFGAKGDVLRFTATGVSITSGTKNLTVGMGAAFVSADVGKLITVAGAGGAGGVLVSSIAAVINATHVTINDNAGTTLTSASAVVEYGTDDSAVVQTYLNSFSTNAGPYIFWPRGVYWVHDVTMAKPRFTFECAGQLTTVFQTAPNAASYMFADAAYVSNGSTGNDQSGRIYRCSFDGNNADIAATLKGIYVFDRELTLEDSRIDDATNDALVQSAVASNGSTCVSTGAPRIFNNRFNANHGRALVWVGHGTVGCGGVTDAAVDDNIFNTNMTVGGCDSLGQNYQVYVDGGAGFKFRRNYWFNGSGCGSLSGNFVGLSEVTGNFFDTGADVANGTGSVVDFNNTTSGGTGGFCSVKVTGNVWRTLAASLPGSASGWLFAHQDVNCTGAIVDYDGNGFYSGTLSSVNALNYTGTQAGNYPMAAYNGHFNANVTAPTDPNIQLSPSFASIPNKPTTAAGYGITNGAALDTLGTGNGSALGSLNASNLASGTVPLARLSIASSNLTDASNLALLNGTQTFSGNDAFSNPVNVPTGSVSAPGVAWGSGTGLYGTATEQDLAIGGVQSSSQTLTAQKMINVSVAPTQSLWRNSASPTAQSLGNYTFDGNNSSAAEVQYAGVNGRSGAVTAGSEIGVISLSAMGGQGTAGTLSTMLSGTGGASSGAPVLNVPAGISVTIGNSLTAEGSQSLNVGTGIYAHNQLAIDASDNGTFATVSAPGTWADNHTCTTGQAVWDANYIYVCTATNTVKRAALSTF